MIRYRYALNEHQKIISIDSITDETKTDSFTCGECGQKLAPRALNSDKVIPHFYHLHNEDSFMRKCNGESYLHWISKELLAESLQQNSPFFLKWEILSFCKNKEADWGMCYKENEHTIDIQKEYPIVSIEKRDGSFIPDILLSNEKGEKIYVEICNSSPCSIEKRNSGNRIIEIKVSNEATIEKIIHRRTIVQSYERVELINFDLDKSEKSFDCGGKCLYASTVEEETTFTEDEQAIQMLPIPEPTKDLESMEFVSNQAISFFETFFDIDNDDENTIIVEILNRMWYFYQEGVQAVKERTPSNKFHILFRGNETQFTFVAYQGKYYGIVFLEYKYFLYTEENNKVSIVCRVKNIESVPNALNERNMAF